jgi:hypothetical protein
VVGRRGKYLEGPHNLYWLPGFVTVSKEVTHELGL